MRTQRETGALNGQEADGSVTSKARPKARGHFGGESEISGEVCLSKFDRARNMMIAVDMGPLDAFRGCGRPRAQVTS